MDAKQTVGRQKGGVVYHQVARVWRMFCLQHSPDWRPGKLTQRDEELRLVATLLLWLVRTAFVFI